MAYGTQTHGPWWRGSVLALLSYGPDRSECRSKGAHSWFAKYGLEKGMLWWLWLWLWRYYRQIFYGLWLWLNDGLWRSLACYERIQFALYGADACEHFCMVALPYLCELV